MGCALAGCGKGLGPDEMLYEAAPIVPASWLLSTFLTSLSTGWGQRVSDCKMLQAPDLQMGGWENSLGFIYFPYFSPGISLPPLTTPPIPVIIGFRM